MALLKIYSKNENKDFIEHKLARSLKLISSAALNCPEIPSSPSSIELVYIEALDLGQIDFIIEIVGCDRPNQDQIGKDIINALNSVYPENYFSVYFNLIEESGMANTPRADNSDKPLSMEEAIDLSK